MNEFVLLAVKSKKANKTNLFIHFLGESNGLSICFWFYFTFKCAQKNIKKVSLLINKATYTDGDLSHVFEDEKTSWYHKPPLRKTFSNVGKTFSNVEKSFSNVEKSFSNVEKTFSNLGTTFSYFSCMFLNPNIFF